MLIEVNGDFQFGCKFLVFGEFDGLFAQVNELFFDAFHGELFFSCFFFIDDELDGEFFPLWRIIVGKEG